MIGRHAFRLLLLSAAFALATLLFGWWGIALVAVAWGIVARESRGTGLVSSLGALLAWAALLAWSALEGPVGRLAATLGGILGAPGLALIALSLLFPAALAWAGARAAAGVAASVTTSRGS